VIAKGKLLTLTTEEALHHGLADVRADNLEALLKAVNLSDAEVRRAAETWAESLVRVLTHPIVSSLLIALGVLGLIIEIQTPGFGVPGGLGLACLALFLWGHWLVQLAGWEEVLLIAGGLLLLAIELFVTPGFGLVGTAGIAMLLGGLGLSLVGADPSWDALLTAVGQVALSLVVAIVAAAALLRAVPRLPFGRKLILQTELPAQAGYASAPEADRRWLGKRGVAASTLRPAGIAHFDHERVDVVAEGEYIEPGDPIEVLRVEGNRIVVRRIEQDRERSEP
jgi:membrane-bound serine protease (ClpP class)